MCMCGLACAHSWLSLCTKPRICVAKFVFQFLLLSFRLDGLDVVVASEFAKFAPKTDVNF